MSTVRETIKDHTRLARLRMGQDAPDVIDIPSMNGVRVAIVPLTEAETTRGLLHGATMDLPEDPASLQIRNRAAVVSDLWHALREPSDPTTKVFESIEDMVNTLEPSDIDHLANHLALLMDYASPSIDGMTDEELNDLKKAFGAIDWSVLTGKRWAAVKLSLSVLLPELLQARLLGSISTLSATETNENGEST